MWLLMAGEVYTTFAFLGAAGWAYSRGGPTFYILAYLVLGYVVSFYFLPQVWEKIPDKEEFLDNLCYKMGEPPDTWRRKHLEVLTYQVEEFSESER